MVAYGLSALSSHLHVYAAYYISLKDMTQQLCLCRCVLLYAGRSYGGQSWHTSRLFAINDTFGRFDTHTVHGICTAPLAERLHSFIHVHRRDQAAKLTPPVPSRYCVHTDSTA